MWSAIESAGVSATEAVLLQSPRCVVMACGLGWAFGIEGLLIERDREWL